MDAQAITRGERMKTASTRGFRAVAILSAGALCVGVALAPPPEPSESSESSEPAGPTEAAAGWRVTEHAGAGLPTDQDSLLAREIYPGYTLAQLDYSPEETEWALYQKPLGDAASVIQTEFADDVGFAYFGPDRAFTMGFSGDAPAGAIAHLDDTGLPYSTIEGLGFSDAEYQAAVNRVTTQVSEALADGDLVPAAGFMIDADLTAFPGAIVVTITGEDSESRQAASVAVGTPSVDEPFVVSVVEGGENDYVVF
jgi:hypothetical protein